MNDLNFARIVDLCINNYIDFEVWNGQTTNKDKSIRRQMVIQPVNAPAIFVAFGDTKHGERVSRMSVSGNDMLKVTGQELSDAVSTENVLVRAWSATKLGMPENLSDSQLTVLDKNTRTVLLTGTPVTELNKQGSYHVYVFRMETPYYIENTKETYVSESYILLKSKNPVALDEKFAQAGKYEYPHAVVI